MTLQQRPAPGTLWSRLAFEQPRYWFVFLPYLVLSLLVTLRHQPWRDEAQAWLLTRDNNLLGILTLERYEVIPGLWHLLLYAPAHLGMPYLTLHVVHWLLNGLAVYVILRWIKGDFQLMAGTVFTYLVFYEYGVIARNYVLALLGMAILAAAWFRPWSHSKRWLYLGFFLTAASSLFSLWLAVPIAVALLAKICQEQGWRKAIVPFASLGAVGILCFLPILPGVCDRFSGKLAPSKPRGTLLAVEKAPDTSEGVPTRGAAKPSGAEQPAMTRGRPSPAGLASKNVTPPAAQPERLARGRQAGPVCSQHTVERIAMTSYLAFTQGGIEEALYLARLPMLPPQWQVGLGLVFLAFAVLVFLVRSPRYGALFLGMTAGVLVLMIAIPLSPAHLRHSCSVFLAFLFCWWLMENDPCAPGVWPQHLRLVPPRLRQLGGTLIRGGVTLMILFQVIAGAVASYQDCQYSFSQAKNTAHYLQAQGSLSDERCFWVSSPGDSAAAVLAYFGNVKMYGLDREEPESFIVWDRKYFENQDLTAAEAGTRLARVARDHPGKTIMVLANKKLRLPSESTRSLRLVRSFEPALKDNESFYIYRYQ